MAEDRADGATFRVEVAYAEPSRQFLRRLDVPRGSTVADAIAASGIADASGVDIADLTPGIWSTPVERDALLEEGDRVELYRPLQVDPKESRRRRAAKPPPGRG